MIVNRSAPGGTIVPRLFYDDVAAAIAWLCDAFGFTERLRIPASGDVGHAQLAIGTGGVMLAASRTEGTVALGPPRGTNYSQTLMVRVDNVDAHFDRARQHGARILLEPATHPYGERQYTAEDPEGHRWTFSQSVADVDPAQWGATASDTRHPVSLQPRPRWCYIEIPAADPHRSADFYQAVFGWDIRHRDTARPSFDDAAGIVSGAWVTGRAPAREPGLLPSIMVDSIAPVLDRVIANGGAVVDGLHPDSPMEDGWIATFLDPGGNLIGLYQEGRP